VNDQLNGPGKYTVTDYKTTYVCEGVFVNGRLEGMGTYSNSPFGMKYKATFQGGNVIPWSNWCYWRDGNNFMFSVIVGFDLVTKGNTDGISGMGILNIVLFDDRLEVTVRNNLVASILM
jgi:hypothetical protein